MRKIAICDDHTDVLEYLKIQCYDFYQDKCDVKVSCFSSAEQLLASTQHFDAIFMDIEMGNMSGLEASAQLRKTDRDVLIIIISAYQSYKSQAYSIHAFDYLDKPIKDSKLRYVLEEIELYQTKTKKNHFVTFKCFDGLMKFNTDDIYYFEYLGRKIQIVTRMGTYEFYDSLSEIEKRIEHYDFKMSHRAFIVNFYHILKITSHEVILENHVSIPIGRSKAQSFKKAYIQYLENHIMQ